MNDLKEQQQKHVLITGGSGFLGNHLADYLESCGHEVRILTRSEKLAQSSAEYVHWDAQRLGEWTEQVEWADVLINLCGRSVDCRYTQANKKAIYDSRLQPTRVLGLAVQKAKCPPELWLNGASATIYRHAEDRPMTEFDGEHGSGFSVDVCERWERMFFGFETPRTRRIALRTTIVLAQRDSALQPMHRMVKFGLGGHQGSGNQWVSWMHIHDFCRAVEFMIKNNRLEGPINLGSPNPVSNKQLMQCIREASGVPVGIPAPRWLLEVGAAIIRTETELILKSRWVIPEQLIQHGFEWEFGHLDKALADLLCRPFFESEHHHMATLIH